MSALGEIIGIIPARAGSKGFPGKHLFPIDGKPLIQYTFEAVASSDLLSGCIVSTNDEEVAQAARSENLTVPFMRPAALADDDTPMIAVLQDALLRLRDMGEAPQVLVLLQPTSPLRSGTHIDQTIERLLDSGADSAVTVVPVPHRFTPGSVLRLENNFLVSENPKDSVTRRQDKPRLFARNGPAVLATLSRVIERGELYGTRCAPVEMKHVDSVDIDTPEDALIAEALLRQKRYAR